MKLIKPQRTQRIAESTEKMILVIVSLPKASVTIPYGIASISIEARALGIITSRAMRGTHDDKPGVTSIGSSQRLLPSGQEPCSLLQARTPVAPLSVLSVHSVFSVVYS